jgi:hypothetical protein
MGWVHAESAGGNEAAIQRAFNSWGAGAAGFAVAAPTWLLKLGRPDLPYRTGRQPTHTVFGLSYKPDVVWSTGKGKDAVVAELKFASKYEPLAVAEALHNGYMLTRALRRPVQPVIIGQYNCWTRAAVDAVNSDGRCLVRHFEIERLKIRGVREHLLWLTDPHAVAVLDDQMPVPLHKLEGFSEWNWRPVHGAATWVGTPDAPPSRLLFHDRPFAILSSVQLSRSKVRYVFWRGSPPVFEARAHRWADSTYRVWVEGTRGIGLPVP